MLRSVTKTCFAYTYSGANAVHRLFHRYSRARAAESFVVCYHRVVENFGNSARHSIPSMLISTAMLERHIDWLAKRYSLVSLDELGSHLESPRDFAKPPAAITFDDGYSDVYYHGFPLLKRKGIPATVFTVTGLISTGKPQIFDRLYLSLRDLYTRGIPVVRTVSGVSRSMSIDTAVLDQVKPSGDEPYRVMSALLSALPHDHVEKIVAALENGAVYSRELLEEMKPMTWDMIASMVREGMTIGSHTRSHALLTSESPENARTELRESKHALEAKLRMPIHHFAYPDGRFNSSVVQEADSVGYRYGYGICRTRDEKFPLLTIPRKVLWERSCLDVLGQFSSPIMNCQANWAFDQRQCSEHNHRSIQHPEKYANVA